MEKVFTLFLSTGDGCSWNADIFAGVFSTKEKAEKVMQELVEAESQKSFPKFVEHDFCIEECNIDELAPDFS